MGSGDPHPGGLGEPSSHQDESAGTPWNLMESSVPWEMGFLLKTGAPGQTPARRDPCLGHWVVLTFVSGDMSPDGNGDFQGLLTCRSSEGPQPSSPTHFLPARPRGRSGA